MPKSPHLQRYNFQSCTVLNDQVVKFASDLPLPRFTKNNQVQQFNKLLILYENF